MSSMNSVSILANRVHWTRFVRLENEFNELGFYSCKPSSLNSDCFKLHHHTCQPLQDSLQAHKKTNTLKKLSSNFKRYTIPSHSQSLSLTRSRALSHSHTLIPSLLLRRRHRRRLLPSPSLPLASVAVVASCFRWSVSVSLSLSPSVVGKLPHKVRTLSFFWVYW